MFFYRRTRINKSKNLTKIKQDAKLQQEIKKHEQRMIHFLCVNEYL